MKVQFSQQNNSPTLFIKPETEFEEGLLSELFGKGEKVTGFLKHGTTGTDVIGLRIFPEKGIINEIHDL